MAATPMPASAPVLPLDAALAQLAAVDARQVESDKARDLVLDRLREDVEAATAHFGVQDVEAAAIVVSIMRDRLRALIGDPASVSRAGNVVSLPIKRGGRRAR